jgi:hypothetical protein
MDDLVLVGVHDDGEHLLLAGPGGQRFRLRVDDALRAAVRRDRARLGQLQIEKDGGLRPREIQARIRSGQSAQEVAAVAGIPVENVRRYEGPVLAERAFVAQQARSVRLRRLPAATGDAASLGEVVEDRLGRRDIEAEHVEWDAWRAEDSTWTVTVRFESPDGSGIAHWSYDPAVRHVAPLDSEARNLTEDEPPAPQRRLAPVRSPMGEAAPARPGPAEEPAEFELLDTLRERRGRRPQPSASASASGSASAAGSDPAPAASPVREAIDTLLSRAEATHAETAGDPPPARPARSRPQDVRDNEVLVLPETAPLGQADTEPPEDDDPEPAPVGGGRRPTSRKQRRPSVPSWDDIVFGQRRD